MTRPFTLPPGSMVRSVSTRARGHREMTDPGVVFSCREDVDLLRRIRVARAIRDANFALLNHPAEKVNGK